ncbi:BCCT family transporter [Streptomyces iconiensis]|uniref:BCCT family transporter n=1 Tax=Streptomyces iconiensis TaxID=1384038 RepID=A0ABT6ZT61_9ACTN|nr:BCCT family transporter [Streptomyces iconiensis]MDJ1132239.1 BCCT family transporter [Streptomyces iconiensis]
MATQPKANPPNEQDLQEVTGIGRLSASVSFRVFVPAAVIILAFVLYAVLGQEDAAKQVASVQEGIGDKLGWYYMALTSLFVVFVLWIGLGRFGRIKLGKDDSKPEFSTGSWFAMLFAAGMGIGLVYWGAAEPLNFFTAPKPGTGSGDAAKSEAAMVQTFLHWGVHPWAIYVVVGLAVAYAVHRKNRPVSIRWALEPLLGDRVKGWWGDVIDIIAVVGTLFGVATSLGLGVMQISSGLGFLDWVDSPGKPLLVVLIAAITGLATLSVVTGIGKGIKWLSNINMVLAAVLLLFVVVAGPTLFIANGFVQNLGGYFQNLLRLSFDTGASQGDDGTSFVNTWTVFYWGWWISWAPFVGVFIARISRGRTVREFVCGVLLVPTLLTFFWFAVFGGTAVQGQSSGKEDYLVDGAVSTDNALFQVLETLPGGTLFAGIAILLIVLFFVTSSDSASFVVDMLSSGGALNPPVWSRVFWALMEGAVAAALLLASDLASADSLNTLKTSAIIIALPFSVIMIGMCLATAIAFTRERHAYMAAERAAEHDRLVDHAVALIEDGGNEADGGPPKEKAAVGAAGEPAVGEGEVRKEDATDRLSKETPPEPNG